MKRRIAACFVITFLSCNIAISATTEVLYGITDTDLVIIDPATPNALPTVVGPHNFPFNGQPGSLAWDSTNDRLFSTFLVPNGSPSPPFDDYYLTEIDRQTGQATILGALDIIKAIDYVPNLDSLVGTKPDGSGVQTLFRKVSLNGSDDPLFTTSPAVDNDTMAYDPDADLFYSFNGEALSPHGTLYEVTSLGATSVLGQPDPDIGARDFAFSADTSGIYATDIQDTNALYHISVAPVAFNKLGNIQGDFVGGLAIVNVPEPSSLFLLMLALCKGFIVRRNGR